MFQDLTSPYGLVQEVELEVELELELVQEVELELELEVEQGEKINNLLHHTSPAPRPLLNHNLMYQY